MITITPTTKHILDQEISCLVFFVEQDFIFSKELKECADCFFPGLKQFMKEREFTGKALSKLLVPISLEDGITNLFAIIGSPFTEDIKITYQKMVDYIHPSIFQGREVNKRTLGQDFKFSRFINEELSRGLDLIEYNLGTSRKMHWEEQQKYYCVGLIEREISSESKTSYLYTFDKDISLRKQFLNYIPSYYVMAILPDYYENLIDQTLKLFGKTSVQSNIRKIKLTHQNKKVLYFEEYTIKNDIKKSYGVILIPDDNKIKDAKKISFYNKNLRLILDVHKDLKDIMFKINPDLKYEKWGTASEEKLNKIRMCLDNID